MDNSVLEKRIRETLEKKAEAVHVDARTSQRIRYTVYQKIEEETNMKPRNWKKVALATAAICVLGSITAVALGRPVYISSHSSHNEIVTDFAEAKAMQNGYDAALKVVEEFSNGYKFKNAVPKYETTHDEEHNALETATTMSFTYGKAGAPDVIFSGDRLTRPADTAEVGDTMVLEDGTKLIYHRMENKFVPPDYKPTEEELALQEQGKLNIGYGSSEIQEMTSVSVMWEQDGVSYSLFSFNDALGAEDMFQMAKEVAEN